MKMNFTQRIYQFAFAAAILACFSAAFAETYTLHCRVLPTDTDVSWEGKTTGLPANTTIGDLTAQDVLNVTELNAQFYFNQSANLNCQIIISGNSTGGEKTGKFRLQEAGTVVNINGPVTLAGDTAIGSHTNGASGSIYFNNQISGTGAFIIGSGTGANVYFNNQTENANNYAGNTQIGANGMYINPASGIVYLGANEQFPNGSGKGNLVMLNSSVLNMSGFTETVNGLESTSTGTKIDGAGKLILGDNNATATYAGTVSGTLALEKIGSGTQTLSGTNSYTGDTTVNGGTLTLSKSFSGKNININNGSTFALGGAGTYSIWLSSQLNVNFDQNGGGTFNTGSRDDGASNLVNNSLTTFTTNGGATNYITGTNGFNLHNAEISFNVAKGTSEDGIDLAVSTYLWNTRNHGIIKNGAGTMLITGDASYPNSYNGGTTINEGTIILGKNGTLGSGAVSVAEGTTLEIQTQEGSTQTWSGGTISGAGTLKVSGKGAFTTSPDKMQIADNGKFIVDGASVTLDHNSTTANGNYSGAEIFINNGGTLTFSRSNSKDQFWLSKQTTITFDANGGGTFSAGGNNTINLVNNAQNKFVTTGGATNYIIGESGFNLHSQNLTFDVAKGTDPNGKDLVVSAKLWNGKGVVKDGDGTMVVTNGNNGYAGGTTINKGTLRLAENGVLGSGGVSIGANGALEFAYEADKTFGNAISGSGKIVKSGDNKVNLNGAFTSTGNMTINDGTLSILMNGTNKSLNIKNISGSGDLELRISNSAGNIQMSSLTNDNFTGYISLVNNSCTDSSKFYVNGKTFEGFTFEINSGATLYSENNTTLAANILLHGYGNGENRGALRTNCNTTGNITVVENGNMAFDGTRTVSGNVTSGGAAGETVTFLINGNASGNVTNSRGVGAFTGSISDGTTGSKLGIGIYANTITFSGDLSYTGPTFIASNSYSPTLVLSGAKANLVNSSAVTVNGTLNFTGYTGESAMKLKNLSGSGAVTGTDKNLILNNDTDTTYTGTLNIGTGAITKDGDGKLTIQGVAGRLTASAYTINDGVLSIESANLIGTAPSVNVAESGTLSLKFDSGSATRFDATNLSGAGVLELALYNGTGNTYLDNLNTTNFTGVVSLVQGGARNGNKLNTSTLAYEGVTFVVNPDTTLFAAGNFKGDVILYGMGNSENRGALRVSNTVSGDITVMTDTLIGCDWGTNTTYHVNSDIVSGAETGEVTVQLKTTGETAIMEFSGSISDGEVGAALGIQVLNGTTPHIFSGDLSYTGATTINSGANIKLTGDGANLVNSRAVAVNGSINFAGYTGESTMQFNNLAGTNGAITGGNNDLILNIEKDTAYSGTIQIGTGTLTKTGVGNLKLLGANDGDLVAGTFNVDEGRLDVKEFFTGNISIKSAGILSPGNSIGTLRDNGDFALDGGTLLMEIGGPTAADSDQLFVTGNLSLTDGSTILLQFTDGYSLAPNAPFEVILDAANSESVIDSVLGSIDSYYFTGLSYALNGDGYWAITGHVDPNAVPEPSTWALLILGAFGLTLARRFQKRSK